MAYALAVLSHQHRQADREARLAPIGEGARCSIYVKDQQGLFARVCGYFDSRNLSILDARVHTTRHGYALDTFLVTDTVVLTIIESC